MYPLPGHAGLPYVGAPAMMPDQPPYYVPQPPMGMMPGYVMPGVQPMAIPFGVAPPMVQQFNPFSVPPPSLPASKSVEIQKEGKKNKEDKNNEKKKDRGSGELMGHTSTSKEGHGSNRSDNDRYHHDKRKSIKEDKKEKHDDEYFKELARHRIREKEKNKSTPTEKDPISSGPHRDRREREKRTVEQKSAKEGKSTKGYSKYQDEWRDERRNQDKGTLLLYTNCICKLLIFNFFPFSRL